MKQVQAVVHILPQRGDSAMDKPVPELPVPHMNDFPPEARKIVREIIAKALVRESRKIEEGEEAS